MNQRRFHAHAGARTSENFAKQGLVGLTGQLKSLWERYVLEELLDNALEATDAENSRPEIAVAEINAFRQPNSRRTSPPSSRSTVSGRFNRWTTTLR